MALKAPVVLNVVTLICFVLILFYVFTTPNSETNKNESQVKWVEMEYKYGDLDKFLCSKARNLMDIRYPIQERECPSTGVVTMHAGGRTGTCN